jgi:Ala-tRNA(Pro) deacylase
LEDLKIKFRVFEHPPFFTVNEAKKHRQGMNGFHIKNLFLRDKKKKSFLVVAHEDRSIDLTQLTERIRSSRLSFGSKERLFEELGVLPGAVTPLSVINNKKKKYQHFFRCGDVRERSYFLPPTCQRQNNLFKPSEPFNLL